jgi:hypothetical protein
MGWDECPMLHVFENCTELIRTLPAVPYNQVGNPEDVDTDSEDHLPDALRYLLMQLGTLARPFLGAELDPSDRLVAPDGRPLLPVIPGRNIAGDTSTGLFREEDQDMNGRVMASPFN